MFKKWFSGSSPSEPSIAVPEVMGLRLGGAFELDALRLKLIESDLIVEGVASTQIIQAVGAVQMDSDTRLLRFYTDDDGYLQVVLSGGDTEGHVVDVKLWYFYDTHAVANEQDWNTVLDSRVSRSQYELEGKHFDRVWSSTGDQSPPVALTEKTYRDAQSQPEETDQFAMLYETAVSDDLMEYLFVAAEEKVNDHQLDRCLVISSGFDVRQADLHIVG